MNVFLHFLQWAYKACLEHEAVIGLLALAFVITMRPKLPNPFVRCELLEWVYEWFHDALKAFMSFRTPNPPPPPGETVSVTDTRTHSVEKTPDKTPDKAPIQEENK